MSDGLDDVRAFIVARITSIELLEVLLLLHRERTQAHTAAGISRTLGSTPNSIQTRLDALAAAGLAAADADGGWRFTPADAALDTMVARLAQAYHERRLAVINLIYAPRDSGGPSDLTLFSDAFRLRKSDEGAKR